MSIYLLVNLLKINFQLLIMKQSKGFTLIELLVVIAIIGILSSIVLASLNTARQRGSDAAIKGALSGLRAEVELEADGGAYDDIDGAGSGTDGVCDTVGDSSGTFATSITDNGGSNYECHDTASGWAAEAELAKGTTYFCVDSSGFAGEVSGGTSIGSADVVCN